MPRPPHTGPDAPWSLLLACLLLAAHAFAPPPVAAQAGERSPPSGEGASPEDSLAVLTGRVLHAGSARPVADARVELVGRGSTQLTDRLGMFRFTGLEPGRDTLAVTALGGPTLRRPVRLSAGRVTRVEMTATAEVVEMQQLEVTVEDDRVASKIERLGERLDRGVGELITREQIDANPGRLSLAFRKVLPARIEYAGSGRFVVKLRNAYGRGHCDPELFVNGFEAPNMRVDDFVPQEVAAVEVYTADVLPADFVTSRARSCGAVAVWTRDFLE